MDFHSLSRRDLQTLCKKNRIPANMTNVAMADALQALQTVEGIEEMKETSQFQSPLKEVRSPNLPRTSRRTSARRAPVPEEPKEQQGSPLPRARLVAIKASEMMNLVSEGEEEKKQGPEEAPKSPDVCTGQKPKAAPSTRRRASKKEEKAPQEEEQKQEDGPKEQQGSPLPRARRVAIKASEIMNLVSENEEEKKQGPEEAPKSPDVCTGQKPKAAPSTRRRASKKEEKAPQEEEQKQEDGPKEQQGSPLPRARRVAIKASEIMNLVSESEEEKKQGPEEAPKSPDVCTGQKPKAAPSTRRRASKKEEKAPQEEEQKQEDGPKEQQGSPLPRARRVAIKASEIMNLVSESEEEKKQGPEEAPKSPDVCTGQKPKVAPSTRRRASKKEEKVPQEEEQKQEDGPKEIPKTPTTDCSARRKGSKETEGPEDPLEVPITPAPRYSRRASARRGAQAPMAGEEKQEETVGLRATRRTRQSTKKLMEETAMDAAANVGRRTTRAKATVKMVALAQKEEQDQEDITAEDSTDQKNDPLQISDVKSDGILMEEENKPEVQNGAISDSGDSGPKKDGNNGVQNLSTDGADSEMTQETENSTPMGKNLGNEGEGEQISEEAPEEKSGKQEDHGLPGLKESPIRGLVSSEPTPEINQEQKEPLDGTPEDNPTVTDGGSEEECGGGEDLDFVLPDPSLSDKIPENIEDSSNQVLETQAAEDSLLIEENLAVELHSEIEATSDRIPVDLIQNKEEEASLDLLPTGNSLEENKVFGDKLPVDQAPETETFTDLQADIENGDAPIEFPYEIPAPEADGPDDGVEIPEDVGESSAGKLMANHTISETESVLEHTTSSPPQQSPPSDATRSPAKTLAVGGDQKGDPADSATESPARTWAQVGDLIGDPADSGIESPDIETSAQVGDLIGESPARTVARLGNLAGDLPDSDLSAGAPVAPDHGGHETNGNETISEIGGGEKKRAEEERVPAAIHMTESVGGYDNKENVLTMVEVSGREAEVKSKAEKPCPPDYNSLSLRKLKALVREKVTNLNNKVEGKRAALAEVNDNRI